MPRILTYNVHRCVGTDRRLDVGRVAEVLPGEVVTQDPWGTIARGQYAILELSDHDAAKEKVLRARPAR